MYRTSGLLVVFIGFMASVAMSDEPLTDSMLEGRASHIVTGKVARVYRTTETFADPVNPKLGYDEFTYYVVEVIVASVEKGKGIQVGGPLYVRLLQERRGLRGDANADEPAEGHKTIPSKGDTIKVFLRQAKDKGYDVLKPSGCRVVSKKT